MRQLSTRISALIVAAALSVGAQAATDPKRAEGYLNDAKEALRKGDPKAAVIQLKNAVQADPDNGTARYELGVVEMRLGDYLSTEKELRAAIDRKYDRDQVMGPLAETMLRLNENQQLLDEIAPGDRTPEVEASVRIMRGYALLNLKRSPEAEKSFDDAVQRTATPARAQLGLARARAAQSDVAGAATAIQQSLDADPKLAEAWAFAAQLKRAQGDNATARSDFDKALELSPNNDTARLGRAALLVSTNELDLADQDVKAVLKSNAKNPLANYWQAQIMARQKNYRAAEGALQNMKEGLNNYPPALYLLATVNLALGETAQAEDNINRYLSRSPNEENGTALLASILVGRQNYARAIEVLKAATAANPSSLRLLGLLSDAYARNGQRDDAATVLNQVLALKPDDADVTTRVAAQLLRIGRSEDAIADLEKATELQPTSTRAGLLLVLTLLQTNKTDEALKAAQELRDRVPDDPLSENLVGAITLRKGDVEGAKTHFRKALEIKPDFTPAAMNLGELAIAERRYDDAGAIFDKILEKDPTNLSALTAHADLSTVQAKPGDAIEWLEKARNGNAQATAPRLRLINGYLALKDPEKAAQVASELEKIAPNDPQAINAVGEARLAHNEMQPAVSAFKKLVDLAPNSAGAYLQLGRAHYIAKDVEAARADFEKAAQLAPAETTVEQQFARFAIDSNSVAREEAYLTGLAAQQKENSAYDVLAGDLLIAAGKPDDAQPVLAAGVAKPGDNGRALARLAQLQARTDPARGADTMAQWLKAHPDAQAVRFLYAGMLLAQKRYDESIVETETVLNAQPNNAAAANNLAWLYQQKKDDRALAMAERAYKSAPNSGDVADTLAWILVQKGDNQRAIEILGKIVGLPGAPPEIRYHLAVALKNTNRLDEAKSNLEEALKASETFDGNADAQALLKELKGG